MFSTSSLRALLLGLLACLPLSAVAAGAPAVAAAADLQFALEAVAARFKADSGRSVRLVFGSSGNFYRQISEGAPFQLFLSADERYVEQLAAAGKTRDQGVLYAIGRIVLLAPQGSALQVDGELQGLRAALAAGKVRRFAIANPEHAPYGQRAEEALRHAGLWAGLQGKLVLGENVAQAAQFATSGNAQGGIIAYSLALAPSLAGRGEWALIPQDWHQPLRQRMVLLNNANATSEAFYRYLQEPAARAIMADYGFTLPAAE
jgi:molybdate transport system substrate-binding protein